MSLKLSKNEYSINSFFPSRTLEDLLQSIVNISSKIMESINLPFSQMEFIESKFHETNSFMDCLTIIESMSTITLDFFNKKPTFNKTKSKINKKSESKQENSKSLLASDDYQNLEKLLQKYEAEIREHVKIEQQMKIYSDSLEDKITEFETEKTDKIWKNKCFEKENFKLKSEVENLKKKKQEIKINSALINQKYFVRSVSKDKNKKSIGPVSLKEGKKPIFFSINNRK